MATNNIEDNLIAAIEIGSSKITGMIGGRMADGSIQIKAFVKEDSSAFIRRGMVCNVDQTTECLKNIKLQLENSIKHRLSNVYVCIGGQSLHSMLNAVTREFDVETKITQEIVNDLYEENRQIAVSDYWLTKIIPQDYYGGNQRLTSSASVAGVVANKIEGNFLNIYYRHKFYELIKECLNSAGFKNVEYMMTPIVLGDSLLSMDAMRTGCVLVDFGKDTTSVAIYSSKLLRRLAVIPLGAGNITKDIASVFKIEESEAEELKRQYGSAYSEKETMEADADKKYHLKDGREIKARELAEIVEARIEEILVNVEEQIKRSGLKAENDLISGAVLTGGGANLRDLNKAFKQFTQIGTEKIKFAKTFSIPVNSKFVEIKKAEGTLNGILSAIAQGKENCVGEEIPEDGGLFGGDDANGGNEGLTIKNSDAGDNVKKLNEHDATEPQKKPEPSEPKKPSALKRSWERLKELAQKLVEPEDTETEK